MPLTSSSGGRAHLGDDGYSGSSAQQCAHSHWLSHRLHRHGSGAPLHAARQRPLFQAPCALHAAWRRWLGRMGWRRKATLLPPGGLGSGSPRPLHHKQRAHLCVPPWPTLSVEVVGVAWLVCVARCVCAHGVDWCVCSRLSWGVAVDGVWQRQLSTRVFALVLRAVCSHVMSR